MIFSDILAEFESSDKSCHDIKTFLDKCSIILSKIEHKLNKYKSERFDAQKRLQDFLREYEIDEIVDSKEMYYNMTIGNNYVLLQKISGLEVKLSSQQKKIKNILEELFDYEDMTIGFFIEYYIRLHIPSLYSYINKKIHDTYFYYKDIDVLMAKKDKSHRDIIAIMVYKELNKLHYIEKLKHIKDARKCVDEIEKLVQKQVDELEIYNIFKTKVNHVMENIDISDEDKLNIQKNLDELVNDCIGNYICCKRFDIIRQSIIKNPEIHIIHKYILTYIHSFFGGNFSCDFGIDCHIKDIETNIYECVKKIYPTYYDSFESIFIHAREIVRKTDEMEI